MGALMGHRVLDIAACIRSSVDESGTRAGEWPRRISQCLIDGVTAELHATRGTK